MSEELKCEQCGHVTVVETLGERGPKGDQGERGPRGKQGERGFRGERGASGEGISLLGVVEHERQLPKEAVVGDAFIVKSEEDQNGHLYVYTDSGNNVYKWLDAGHFKGDKGNSLRFRWDGTELGIKTVGSLNDYEYRELQGPRGPEGPQGPRGRPGERGRRGPSGSDGTDGENADITTYQGNENEGGVVVGSGNNMFMLVWGTATLQKDSNTTLRKPDILFDENIPNGYKYAQIPNVTAVISSSGNVSPSSSYLTGVMVNNVYSSAFSAQVRKDFNEVDLEDGDEVEIMYQVMGVAEKK